MIKNINKSTDIKWDGDYYHNNSLLQRNIANYALSKIQINPDEQILDIGCGDGFITAQLAQELKKGFITGVDASLSMIDYAKNKYSNLSNIAFDVINAEDLDFDSQFDTIISFNCFHWIKDQKKALTNIHKALKPNGIFLLLALSDKKNQHLIDIIKYVASLDKWKQYYNNINIDIDPFNALDLHELAQTFANLNMSIEYEETIQAKCYFEDKNSVLNWLSGWIFATPQGSFIPEHLRQEFIEDMISVYLKNNKALKDNKIVAQCPELIIIAQKNPVQKTSN